MPRIFHANSSLHLWYIPNSFKGRFVIIAVFSLDGAQKCSGLDVKNYDHKMIEEYLGKDFKLLKHFPYLYKMPSGDLRPYVYTLFKRTNP